MDVAKEAAIREVQQYLINLDFLERLYGYSQKQLSYSKWATKTILESLKSSTEPPLKIIEDFRDTFYEYWLITNERTMPIFEASYMTAVEIIDNLIL